MSRGLSKVQTVNKSSLCVSHTVAIYIVYLTNCNVHSVYFINRYPRVSPASIYLLAVPLLITVVTFYHIKVYGVMLCESSCYLVQLPPQVGSRIEHMGSQSRLK